MYLNNQSGTLEHTRKLIEAELRDKVSWKVRNVFFLCRSAGDFRSIYVVQGNNNSIKAIAFVDDFDAVELVL